MHLLVLFTRTRLFLFFRERLHYNVAKNVSTLRYKHTLPCSFTLLCVLGELYSLFESEFSTECGLVLLVSIYSILSFSEGHPVSSSCWRLLPVTFNLPSIFPSITCIRRQFLRNMWHIQLSFLPFMVCRHSPLFLDFCNTSSFADDLSYWSSTSFSRNSQVFLIYSPKCPYKAVLLM